MLLRICDGQRERREPFSIALLEDTFGSEVPLREGTEITLVDGERWLAAVAVGGRAAGDQLAEFLLSGSGEDVAGRVGRNEVLRQFRQFVLMTERA
jgi:hypothetical protein